MSLTKLVPRHNIHCDKHEEHIMLTVAWLTDYMKIRGEREEMINLEQILTSFWQVRASFGQKSRWVGNLLLCIVFRFWLRKSGDLLKRHRLSSNWFLDTVAVHTEFLVVQSWHNPCNFCGHHKVSMPWFMCSSVWICK